jgi:hypothetical protein
MTIKEIEDSTPYELFLICEAYQDKQLEDIQKEIMNAWYNAYFQRVKKLNDLKEYIKPFQKQSTYTYTDNREDDITKLIIYAKRKGLRGFWGKGGRW